MKYEFTKKTNSERFLDLKYVLRARNKKRDRYMCDCLLCASKQIICTDGKRVHVVNNFPLPDGGYEVINETKDKVTLYKFANIKASDTDFSFVDESSETIGIFPKWEIYHVSHSQYFTAATNLGALHGLLKKDVGVNLQYLDDIMRDFTQKWDIFFYTPQEVLYFVSGNREALLMPVELEELNYKTIEDNNENIKTNI